MATSPSPFVPLLIVGVLSVLVFGPIVQSLFEIMHPVVSLWGDAKRSFTFLMLFFLIAFLTFMYLVDVFSPSKNGFSGSYYQQSDGLGFEGEGFGLGSLLLAGAFFVLYYVM